MTCDVDKSVVPPRRAFLGYAKATVESAKERGGQEKKKTIINSKKQHASSHAPLDARRSAC